ncbi:hypothetical protein [Enterococcus avium]|uniref:hypothetical protein n=1 Tax=Enterococcus TaxID=1350 RepID=UPI001CED0F24|nr:hypothetical protein [Enterococcus avium]
MDLIKQYVKKRRGQYLASIALAIVCIVSSLVSYIYMAKIIVGLINGNANKEYYLLGSLMILLMFIIKEISSGLSTMISHTATFHALGEIIIFLINYSKCH